MLYLVGISDTELENNDGANPLPQPEKVRSCFDLGLDLGLGLGLDRLVD